MNVSINAGSFLQKSQFTGVMLKSTQEKMQRQQECNQKVAFYENRIAMLKNSEAGSLEEISRKLEMFHSYQDSIAAAKKEYNNQQMSHIMDEAIERGEKIAEAAKDMEPKTPEERLEEKRKEALGIEEGGGLLESMEEIVESSEELLENMEDIMESGGELPESMEDIVESSGELLDEAREKLFSYQPFDSYA